MRSVRSVRGRFAGLCLGAAVSAGVAGCGGNGAGSNVTRTGSTPLEQRADGSLTRHPDPLSVEDLQRLPPDSPQSVVFRLWFYGQWGDSTSASRLYDRRILDAVGGSSVAGAYAMQRVAMLDSRPKVRSVVRHSVGTLVTIDMLTGSAPPRREFFIIHRRAGGWRIVYDSYLEKALPDYVRAQQVGATSRGSAASPDTGAAGVAAVNEYRKTLLGDLSAARATERR